jgi:two-component sensor histidine kinase
MMSIREDRSGNLWIGTNNGLLKFNIKDKKFTKYTVEDGLCSGEFQANAVCSDTKNGLIYFGTANGVVSFNPVHIVSNSYVPPVVITDIKILDQSLASIPDTSLVNIYRREKKLLLKYDQNFFSFEFAALNYNNSKANKYAYILEGVDRQWHQAGTQNFAGYTDIRPGHYTFKVKASNNDGVWNDQPVIVGVVISPPWWNTWWFYTLCFLAACAIIYVIYRIRIEQVLKVYRLRSSIAKDLHDDVGSALSSIALLSNISEKAKTKASLKPEEIFSRIGDTSKRMIDLMDDIVWSVNPDNDRFSNMLVRMREYAAEMLESKNIDFSFHIANDIDELRIPMQMRKDYFLIFKEAINNLAKCSDCTHANISIEKVNKNIITTIADNGKGFDAQIINSGNGLKNMQQRALAIKAKLHIETGPGKGTSITLIMPA